MCGKPFRLTSITSAWMRRRKPVRHADGLYLIGVNDHIATHIAMLRLSSWSMGRRLKYVLEYTSKPSGVNTSRKVVRLCRYRRDNLHRHKTYNVHGSALDY